MTDQPPPFIDNTRWLLGDAPPWNPWVMAGIVAAVLIFIGLIAAWFLRRKKLALPFFAPPSPGEVALKALREIEPLLAGENAQQFIIKLSEILRVYLEGRFGLRALHLSTEEFLLEARDQSKLAPQQQELLKTFLFQCDLVKFARRDMVREQMAGLLQTAEDFVQSTAAPAPPPERAKS